MGFNIAHSSYLLLHTYVRASHLQIVLLLFLVVQVTPQNDRPWDDAPHPASLLALSPYVAPSSGTVLPVSTS